MSSFAKMYDTQIENQELLLAHNLYSGVDIKKLPADSVALASYHIQQLVSEIGEVLACDKRWKNLRNDVYDKAHKVEEIADCFIVAMNIAIFSGINADELESAITNKLQVVNERFKEKISCS